MLWSMLSLAASFTLFDFEKRDWAENGTAYYGYMMDDFEDGDLNGWDKWADGGFAAWEVVPDPLGQRNGSVWHFRGDDNATTDSWIWSGSGLDQNHKVHFTNLSKGRIGLWVMTNGTVTPGTLLLEVKTTADGGDGADKYYYDVTPSDSNSWEFKVVDLSQPDINGKPIDDSDIKQVGFKLVGGGVGDKEDVFIDNICFFEIEDPANAVSGWMGWDWGSSHTLEYETALPLSGDSSVHFNATLGTVGSSGSGMYCDWVPYATGNSIDWLNFHIKNAGDSTIGFDVIVVYDADGNGNRARYKKWIKVGAGSDLTISLRLFGSDGKIGTSDDNFEFKEGDSAEAPDNSDVLIGMSFDFYPLSDNQAIDVYIDDISVSDSALGVVLPTNPTIVSYTDSSTGNVVIGWAHIAGNTKYHVYRDGVEVGVVTASNTDAYLTYSEDPGDDAIHEYKVKAEASGLLADDFSNVVVQRREKESFFFNTFNSTDVVSTWWGSPSLVDDDGSGDVDGADKSLKVGDSSWVGVENPYKNNGNSPFWKGVRGIILRTASNLTSFTKPYIELRYDTDHDGNEAKYRFYTESTWLGTNYEIKKLSVVGIDGKIGGPGADLAWDGGDSDEPAPSPDDPVMGVSLCQWSGGEWYIDSIQFVYDDNDTPLAPENLTAVWNDTTYSVHLSWDAPAGGESVKGYRIYRSTFGIPAPDPAYLIGVTTSTSFEDPNVASGVTYYYAVYSADWLSKISETATTAQVNVPTYSLPPVVIDDFEEYADSAGLQTNWTKAAGAFAPELCTSDGAEGTSKSLSVIVDTSGDTKIFNDGVSNSGFNTTGYNVVILYYHVNDTSVLQNIYGSALVFEFWYDTDGSAGGDYTYANEHALGHFGIKIKAEEASSTWKKLVLVPFGPDGVIASGDDDFEQFTGYDDDDIATINDPLKTFYLKLRRAASDNYTFYIDQIRFEKDVTPPHVEDLAADVLSEPLRVKLSWSASDDLAGIYKYYIYRSTSPITSLAGLSPLAVVDTPTYTDSAVEEGKTYYYAVVARDKVGNDSPLTQANMVSVLALSRVSATFNVPKKGTKASVSGAFSIEFPAEAVPGDSVLSVNSVTMEGVSCAYDFILRYGEEILHKLLKPIKITLYYKVDANGFVVNTDVPEEEADKKLAIFYYDGHAWHNLGGKVDKENRSITVYVDHLSVFAIKAVGTTATELTLTAVGPNPVKAGSSVVFSLVNPKSESLTAEIRTVSGKLVEKAEIGAASSYTWDVPKDAEAGVYIFTIKGESKTIRGVVVVVK